MSPQATTRNADLLRPDVIRNQVVETVDQMERIQLADEQGFASALNTFPVINLDDPDAEFFTYDGAVSRMKPVDVNSESPIGTLDLPERRGQETQSYKIKFQPDKGIESRLSDTPFSVHQRAVQKIQLKIYLTREQISWRGDEQVEGLIGETGTDAHDEIPAENVIAAGTAWSDHVNSDPVGELAQLAYQTTANGFYGGGVPARPTIYLSPSVLQDLKQNQDMQDRLSGVRVQNVTRDTISEIIDEDLGGIRRVMVQVPRENADGQLIDENGNPVDDPDDAAHDNVLEPWDPAANAGAGGNVRNVVVGRAGPQTAYFPWYLDDLTETMDGVDIPGDIAIDDDQGFFVQRTGDWDPIGSWIKGAQDVGFTVERGRNLGVIRGV